MAGVLEQELDALGETIVVDAEFGGSTEAAVKRFQHGHPPLAPNGIAGELGQRRCTQPFLYNTSNLMTGAEADGSGHTHDVEPRHVRHFCALLGQAAGGVWEPAR
jgi:hypothetical protein